MTGNPQSVTAPAATAKAAQTLPSTRLYIQSGAARFGLSEQEFTRILFQVKAKYLPEASAESGIGQFYEGLHLEELALAHACAAGNETAWETFLTRYRAKLYDAARAITKDDQLGHELADSIYADLYGVGTREGQRVSKLSFYMGRGSLEGWLRTVLAQEFVNRYRTRKHMVSLEEQTEQGAQFPAAPPEGPPEIDPRLHAATDQVLACLAAEDRLILISYFLDGRTLAEIARMVGVHESTISRKLDKVVRRMRDSILRELMHLGMNRRQAEEGLEVDVRDFSLDIRSRLTQGMDGRSFNNKEGGLRR